VVPHPFNLGSLGLRRLLFKRGVTLKAEIEVHNYARNAESVGERLAALLHLHCHLALQIDHRHVQQSVHTL
jgi:hypothetical protein